MASDRKIRRPLPRVKHAPEYIEPELTPPPVSVDELPGFDSIPPPIQEQLRMLSARQDRALSARAHGEWLERVDEKLGAIATCVTRHETVLDQMLVPGFKECAASTDKIAHQLPKIIASLEAVTLTVGNIDHRLRNLEVRMETNAERADARHAALDLRVAEAEALHRSHTLRLKEIEDKQLSAEATEKALAKTSRKSGGASGGIVGAIVAAAIAAAQAIAK